MRAKETVYWPGMNEQLEQLILNCQLCLKYSRSKDKNMPNTALGHKIPSVPWSKVATDIFHFESKSYLLVVNYTSRFPIVREIKSMSTQHIAEHFRLIFLEYGWPDTLVSDNGPCYVAKTFTSLMKEYAVNHITSSPHYPRSNGLAEKFVQIVKNLFYKVKDEGTDIYKCLMIYHNTPLANTAKSPMQMLQQRSARSQLPMLNTVCRQLGVAAEQTTATKKQHLPSHDLHIGQEVLCQDFVTKRWFPTTIKALCPEPRSYQIETSERVIYRRTQNHLKPYRSHWKTPRREQSNQNMDYKQSNMNQTSVKNSDNRKQSHPKRQIKIPLKLNLYLLRVDL